MWADEAEAKWKAEKAALLAELAPLSRKEKCELIVAAKAYRSGPDPYNSLYMGSMATHSLFCSLGGDILRGSLDDLLKRATDQQISAALDVCANIIKHMGRGPIAA